MGKPSDPLALGDAQGAPQIFLPAARLWAVFLLRATGTCEQILDLMLGPIKGDGMAVSFRGRRHRKNSNADPASLVVEGHCQLGS